MFIPKRTIANCKNISEIRLMNTGDNLFTLSIKADIECDGKLIKNSIFEMESCQIESQMRLIEESYLDCDIGTFEVSSGYKVEGTILRNVKYLNVPISIKLPSNKDVEELYNIK